MSTRSQHTNHLCAVIGIYFPTLKASSPKEAFKNMDIPLMIYFAFWYLGNYYYNIQNKTALKAAGGAAGTFCARFG